MYYKLALIIFSTIHFYIFFAFSNEVTNCNHDVTNFRCVSVVDNYDGDTITVNIKDVHPLLGNRISVRINGIDTPEIKTSNLCEKEAGRNAKKLVAVFLKNAKRVDLVNIKRDKYFRILSDVFVDGQSIKGLLLKNKLAYEYDGGAKQQINWCQFTKRAPASL